MPPSACHPSPLSERHPRRRCRHAPVVGGVHCRAAATGSVIPPRAPSRTLRTSCEPHRTLAVGGSTPLGSTCNSRKLARAQLNTRLPAQILFGDCSCCPRRLLVPTFAVQPAPMPALNARECSRRTGRRGGALCSPARLHYERQEAEAADHEAVDSCR